tara:strand:- start:2180 stop:2614 length:435 start_codon:yes stop_codon:yes gene_type:complete
MNDTNKNGKTDKYTKLHAELFDIWEDLKKQGELMTGNVNAVAAELQQRWQAYLEARQGEVNAFTLLTGRVERRKFNVEARMLGKELPFPNEEGSVDDVIKDVKEILVALKARTLPDPVETAVSILPEAAHSPDTENAEIVIDAS